MIRAVQKVRERLLRATAALARANVPYAVIGGNAISSGTRGASGGSTAKPRHHGRWVLTRVANWSRFGPVMPW